MIVVTLTYKTVSRSWRCTQRTYCILDHYYEQKKFLASGRRENRVGGVILVLSSSIQEAEKIIKNDPFYIHDVADYDFMWFEPSKSLEEIKEFV